MRILVVSDIHANLAALEAVLRDALRQGSGQAEAAGPIDAVWNLGDCVGYGPQPCECVARMREMDAVMVAGNHERAATGAMSVEDFNPDAARAALWTRERLNDEEKAYLDALPEVIEGPSHPSLKAGAPGSRDHSLKAEASGREFTLVHGTLRWPVWEYLYSYEAALAHLQLQRSPFSFVGHTHVPALARQDERSESGCELFRLEDGEMIELTGDRKLVLNPGSVGQPRDGDPRASYALYDTEAKAVTLRRVEYEITATQKLMEEARLPRWLIERLSEGR